MAGIAADLHDRIGLFHCLLEDSVSHRFFGQSPEGNRNNRYQNNKKSTHVIFLFLSNFDAAEYCKLEVRLYVMYRQKYSFSLYVVGGSLGRKKSVG